MRTCVACLCCVFLLHLTAWTKCAAAGERQAADFAAIQQAAQQGNVQAQAYLGWAYDIGKEVPKDEASAAFWYQKAAEQGNVIAQYNLGLMYAAGRGVRKHDAYAKYWFQKAADQGYLEAQKILQTVIALSDQTSNENINSQMNITALFLAGMDLPDNNGLEKFTQTSFYKKYKTEFSTSWERFQETNINKIREWWDEKIAQTYNQNIFYPFSGPDIFNALAFFPDGDTYTLFGLEPVGTAPNIFDKTDIELTTGLKAMRKSINTIFGVNFFRTLDMEKDIKNNSFSCISSILMAFLAKCGYTVIDVKNIAIDSQSTVVSWEYSDRETDLKNFPASQRIPGVEITFKRENGKNQIVRYFKIDVRDENLENRNQNFLPYIEKNIPYATMLKSASYLLHYDNSRYTKIRSAIINCSNFIIQDDSAIPLRYFKNDEWTVTLHGIYNKPISLFANRMQNDLKEAYSNSTGILPFSYGYNHKQGESNILTAKKNESSTKINTKKSEVPHATAKDPAAPDEPESDFKKIENSALQGNADSQYQLGWLYYHGIYVQKNENTAARWYRQAAEQGHAEAQNWLGFMYAEGKGVQKNYIKAGHWYQKAAEQGHAEAKKNLEIIKGYGG